ncbi:TPA: thermonuclease family protein [Citrobacter freundii]|uniref:thermonuclease family protein n=1 Tax=Citrobacter sp. CFSAN044567 TaxID=1897730 RepID=UPI00084634C1|nr:thermonuclease family protein [Citrobacter sp. CFSAN044567]HBG9400293.1 thermonuclease family protein [Citrobacter freundii]HEG1810817.1 thermonuclease family protein [Citrobacter freundii]
MSRLLANLVSVLFFAIFSASAVTKNEVKVIRVIDGDTFVISNDSKHIRMAEIDAPEKTQSYGVESYMTLKNKIEGKVVILDVISQDKYGRLISNVYLNGESVNRYLVSIGSAWVYEYYCKDKSLYSLQYKSKITKKGLWREDRPLPPWKYRELKNKAI